MKDDMKTLLVHKAHQNNKNEWTVREVWENMGKQMSQKQVWRGLKELEALGLIEHETNAEKYYFQSEA